MADNGESLFMQQGGQRIACKVIKVVGQLPSQPVIPCFDDVVSGVVGDIRHQNAVKSKVATNKDGSPRENSIREKLEKIIAEQKSALAAA
jgi:hypothetical protein